MNEQQNQAIVQSMYDAFGRGDVQAILNNMTSDADWIFEAPEIIPYAGVGKGPAAALRFFGGLATTQTGQKLTVDYIVAQGDKVASYGRYAATVTATGKSFNAPFGHFFTIRDGKVTSFVNLGDTAAVVEAYT